MWERYVQETKLLQSVDRLKGDADVVRHEQRIAGALASMATPKQWSLSNGGLLNVHTPATTRSALPLLVQPLAGHQQCNPFGWPHCRPTHQTPELLPCALACLA